MVRLHVKKGDKSLFLFDTKVSVVIGNLLRDILEIFNGKLKIERLLYEIEELSKYGVTLPPEMQGLTAEETERLGLKDEWAESNLKNEEYVICHDPNLKRNGLAPTERNAEILMKTIAEARLRISQEMIDSGKALTLSIINDTLDILSGAVSVCYPMDLPPYENIRLELENKERFSGTHAGLDESTAELWWASKQLDLSKALSDYIGTNEKTKLVVKLQKSGHGPPVKEPVLSEEQQKDLMLARFRRIEQLKKLTLDDDDSHLDSEWADSSKLKKSFHGLDNIKFK